MSGNDALATISDGFKRFVAKIQDVLQQVRGSSGDVAVEAARAGEQGRGFAVVASEVRTLAQRSAVAAKDIKGLIGNAVAQVGAGTALVGTAGRTMDEVVDSVRRVTATIGEIAAASAEQSAGLAQINASIGQIDGITQQNAALVEEAAAAADSLQQEADRLVALVGQFRWDDDRARRVAVPGRA